MKIELCDEFFYRITATNMDIYKEFNTSNENILRNNQNIKFYSGETIKIKVNNFKTHFVKPAETLQKIADFYKVDILKLKEYNNLENDKLYIGQRLKIYDKKPTRN